MNARNRMGILLGLFLLPWPVAVHGADENYSFTVGALATPTPTPPRDMAREQGMTRVYGNSLQPLSSQFPQVILQHKYYGEQEEGEPSFVIVVPDIDGNLKQAKALRDLLAPLTPNALPLPKSLGWGLSDSPEALEKKYIAFLAGQARKIPPKARVKVIALGAGGLLAKNFLSQGSQGLLANPAVNALMGRVDRFISVNTPYFGCIPSNMGWPKKETLSPALEKALGPDGSWISTGQAQKLDPKHLGVDYRLVAASNMAYSGTGGYGTSSAMLQAVPSMFAEPKFHRDPNHPNRWREDRTEISVVDSGSGDPFAALAQAAVKALFDRPQVTLYRLRRGKELAPELGGTVSTLMDYTTDAQDKDSVNGFLAVQTQDPADRDLDPVPMLEPHEKLELLPASSIRLIDPTQVWGILRDFAPTRLAKLEASLNFGPFVDLLGADADARDPERSAALALQSCVLDPSGLLEISHDASLPTYWSGLRFRNGVNHLVFHSVNWAGAESTQALNVNFNYSPASVWPVTPGMNCVLKGDHGSFPAMVLRASVPIGGVPTGKMKDGRPEYEVRPAVAYSGLYVSREDSEDWGPNLAKASAQSLDLKTQAFPDHHTETVLKLDLQKAGLATGPGSSVPSGRYKVWLAYSCPYMDHEDACNDYFSFTVDNEKPVVEWVKPAGKDVPVEFHPYARDGKTPDRLVLCYRTSDPYCPVLKNIRFSVKDDVLTISPPAITFETNGLHWVAWEMPKLDPGARAKVVFQVEGTNAAGEKAGDEIPVLLVR